MTTEQQRSQARKIEAEPPIKDGTATVEPERREVRVGCIGRGHAGKTALFRALAEGPVGDYFTSGLHLDMGDPREVARMIQEAEMTQRILKESGLPPTMEISRRCFYLYDGERRRAALWLREVIGQVLTHTLPNSEPGRQARYSDYLSSLVNANVLWAVIPCPPANPSHRDRRRYANDLRITGVYLREALRLRSVKQPAAVALVLTKIDTLFGSAEEARTALAGETLLDTLGPLVHLIEQSSHVADAAILPVTSFGFGNATRRESGGGRNGAAPEDPDDPFGGEPIWLLKEGVSPQPYNLDSLMIWSLLIGLLNQLGPSGRPGRADRVELCRRLYDDLMSEDRWLVPLRGRLTRPESVEAAV